LSFSINLTDGTVTPFSLATMLMHSSGSDADTLIVELLAFFAEDESKAIQFLDCFGGRTIHVPSAQRVKEAFLSVQVYLRCEELHKTNVRTDVLTQVAAELSMTRHVVATIWKRVEKQCKKLEEGLRDCLENRRI
jgi:hypothetical protein